MAIYKRLRLLECAGGAQAHKLGTCTLQLPHPKDQYKIEPIGASCWATFFSFTRSYGKQPSDLMAEIQSPASK